MKKANRDLAGKTAEHDLPIQYWRPESEPSRDDQDDIIDFLLAFAIIIAFITLFMWFYGRFQ